ncbi:hypothetical protein D3C73_1247390 [compost metagenome]
MQCSPHAEVFVGSEFRVLLRVKGFDQMRCPAMGEPIDGRRAVTNQNFRLDTGNARILAIGLQEVFEQTLRTIMYKQVRQAGFRWSVVRILCR